MKGDMEIEVLNDPGPRDDARRARKRMASITASADEQLNYKCAPNEARGNDNPGIPLADYGTKFR